MKRILVALAAVVALAAPASAASTSCARDFKGFWDTFSSGPAKELTGEQFAMVARQALRAHDACSAGDEARAKSIFDTIREAAPAKGEDFWKKLAEQARRRSPDPRAARFPSIALGPPGPVHGTGLFFRSASDAITRELRHHDAVPPVFLPTMRHRCARGVLQPPAFSSRCSDRRIRCVPRRSSRGRRPPRTPRRST